MWPWSDLWLCYIKLYALWLYKIALCLVSLVSYMCVCDYIHTLLLIYLCIVCIYLVIYLFIYSFLCPIYWFGTCGVFDDCQYIGV